MEVNKEYIEKDGKIYEKTIMIFEKEINEKYIVENIDLLKNQKNQLDIEYKELEKQKEIIDKFKKKKKNK